MSAKHPTPWTIEGGDNGKRGKLRREWAYILDARGVYVVDGMDLATAREIVEAVNERDRLRKAFEDISEFANGMTSEEDEANALTILDICAKALEGM